ncbi:YitT family protein [Carboxylicivirga linearis]|uniref:YitT family protein n=1 Tax=Carboxylicivirga linearis TaxID=1628157 RepID=A0ABS5JSM7_9BACT|nr:YitT family protein [Carboxylicivirga linearis]MBS2097805.1 YitT family protein [Carboxylicivirga linearis]
MTTNKIISELRSYLMLTIGLAIGTLGWTGFLIPAKIVGGGLTGIATILYFIFGWDVGLSTLIINIALILIAMKVLGASFGIKTIYCVLVFSGLLTVMRPFFDAPIVSELMMNSIIGGILGGIGAGIVFVNGGSTGGVDIIAMIINKYKNISLGRLLLGMDVIIISSSFFLVQTSSIETVVYGFMTMAVLAYTVDLVISGNKQTVQFFIISSKPEQIQKSVIFEANRGLTVLHGTGGYSGEPRKVLMVIAKKSDTQMIFKVVKQIDADAFITVGTVMGVYGQGFDKIKI